MSGVEVFLDDTPGETRGIIRRDGRYTHLLIDREDDEPRHRLGARSVGRVADAPQGLKGAFIDLGTDLPGFMPLKGPPSGGVGDKLEVEVTAEPREGKGATLRRAGTGQGEPRLLAPGPSVREALAALAPDATPVTGIAAIDAAIEAEEDAAASGGVFRVTGLDLMVERTRALIAVDLDLSSGAAAGGKARDRANRQGLAEAARLIGLKRWGGLTMIDLIGVGHDGAALTAAARAAFGTDPEIVYGPISRFGVMQLSLPWRRTPLDDLFKGPDGGRGVQHRAQDLVRTLRRRLLSDTLSSRIIARCDPDEAAIAAPLVTRLGPRAGVRSDAAVAPGAPVWEEG